METSWVPPLRVAVVQRMMVGSCGRAAAVGVMSVVVGVSNLGEGPLGVNSAPTAGEQAAEPPPPAAAELSSPAVQLTYVASYDVDLDQAFLTETELFPNLDVELDQEGATWMHDCHEDRWAHLVDHNMHIPGLTTAFADVDAFKLVTDRMRQAISGRDIVFELRHNYEGVDLERRLDVITQDNIMYNMRMKYYQDIGYDAGGLSRQGAYTLTLTLTLTHSHTHTLTAAGGQRLKNCLIFFEITGWRMKIQVLPFSRLQRAEAAELAMGRW